MAAIMKNSIFIIVIPTNEKNMMVNAESKS